jgi:hypothetical protein
MREMEIKVRDLSASRELWKEKALAAQEQQEKLERELEEFKKSGCIRPWRGFALRAEETSACVAPRN